ncbi:phenazine biosynthesis protein PhzF family [Streptantibioticus cattleyicolor NRRL 8057 = DSM 46488]|uniref:Phenazine biosynthesis protein PhzF family n=1 Tax=Streptantibioticus cattleyicolor (strain ATCC 35852 / DSM 46488 / JCM 4925 / NBRC 14057 / NRRL 8057) TaxID=1003195 RepID=F8K244_STREN|nr:phenazine biosynthesis protein PhzF family [Streptantibioticus cattleyicolor NRRL 8057 = DSM 46488]MYS58432.1 PhzF family phenazine biosynthesis isomerase [Streptomyces sp. SID5468]CCB74089.1 putative oxidoreductase [Streptantibioticus cattleyicolor NRRL 8057 = DSM 46488]
MAARDTATEVLRYTAFSADPAGGNPAGVVLDARGLDDAAMQRIAAGIGYSETAFVTPGPTCSAERDVTVRYFSPVAEVPFCGHATIATAVALAERAGEGTFTFATRAGEVPVSVVRDASGALYATLSSVDPYVEPIAPADLAEALAALRWPVSDLDPALPSRVAYAGARHLVVAAATRERLADLDYDFARLAAVMTRLGLTTVQLVWRESPEVFHVRNPFPVGGVVEDPATGAAAAAFGGYLRTLGLVGTDASLTLFQGADLGRPSRLTVELRPSDPRVHVSGTATRLTPG